MTEQVCDPERSGPFGSGDGKPEEARQMPLPFRHERRFDEAGFVGARSNAAARTWLFASDAQKSWSDGRLVLWGGPRRGKTHLLRLWGQRQDALIVDAEHGLPDVATLVEQSPCALALDALPDHGVDELALLRIINTSKERQIPLLMTARTPPGRWQVSLPDLCSRLRATMVVEVGAAEDVLLYRLMLRLLAERQLVVSRHVTDWLLHRLPREAVAIEEAVRRIDVVTLATAQPLDRAAASRVLAAMHEDGFSG
ncbi:chromosomal replication initiator DnaA [Acetobacter sp. LMG 1627]|uniref:Chromosomal replication initiator DnaA n=1 Tax=Acetobacter conturbans TaxID=1737472 RepID=A0ABX0JYM8_9PROT|nr:chromosomal replication initiator DnaA [Acetobacter conturbans]